MGQVPHARFAGLNVFSGHNKRAKILKRPFKNRVYHPKQTAPVDVYDERRRQEEPQSAVFCLRMQWQPSVSEHAAKHARLISQIGCESQRCILLKSQAARIMAKNRGTLHTDIFRRSWRVHTKENSSQRISENCWTGRHRGYGTCPRSSCMEFRAKHGTGI